MKIVTLSNSAAIMEDSITEEREQELIQELAPLLGNWRGAGSGSFPTIDSFDFEEELTLESRKAPAVIRYEQRTWLKGPEGERASPSHWEVGFIRVTPSGELEIANVQANGRVEVLRGERVAGTPPGDLSLTFDSLILANDERMCASRRRIDLRGEELCYSIEMATRDTPLLQVHIESALRRA